MQTQPAILILMLLAWQRGHPLICMAWERDPLLPPHPLSQHARVGARSCQLAAAGALYVFSDTVLPAATFPRPLHPRLHSTSAWHRLHRHGAAIDGPAARKCLVTVHTPRPAAVPYTIRFGTSARSMEDGKAKLTPLPRP